MTVGYGGERVVLRPRTLDDRRTVREWLLDPARHVLSEADAWPPAPLDVAERQWAAAEETSKSVVLSIDVDDTFVGQVVLYDVDLHNRKAMIGIVLGPECTGQGIGRDAMRTMARYAFSHRGLHRLGLQVLATNERAIRCYRAVGFVEEGVLRDHAWVDGEWVDELQMSLLATDEGASA